MTPSQHAKVLEALEFSQRFIKIHCSDMGDAGVEEALSIMRSEGVGWQPISTAPRDGSVFVVARFVEGEEPEPGFDYELGHYKPLVFDRYEEAGDNLFRKVPEQVYDWHGFNNFGRMTHWMPLPAPPIEPEVKP